MVRAGEYNRRRGAKASPKPQTEVEADFLRGDCDDRRRGSAELWLGLCRIPGEGRYEVESLRIGDREPLLCRSAEKREDAVHLRSAPGADLRPRLVPACGIPAVLVFKPASGAANRYLMCQRGREI